MFLDEISSESVEPQTSFFIEEISRSPKLFIISEIGSLYVK